MIADLRLAETLRELIDTCQPLFVSRGEDGEYTGNLGIIRRCTSETLDGCLEGLTPNPRTKVCIRDDCVAAGRARPLSCFGPDRDSADGHASVCKPCESKRIGGLNRKRKLDLAASHQDKPVNTSG